MTQQNYFINLPRRILNTLKANLGDVDSGGFRTYWDGDPLVMGDSQLPALIVDWQTANLLPGATGQDKWQHNIIIKVVLNKMDDIGVLDVQGGNDVIETPTKKRLEQFIFGRDRDTGHYLTKSILGILRTNFTMASNEITQEPTVEFGGGTRPNGPESNIVTAEAHITVAAQEIVAVPSRT